jgi:hypothetical protein
MNLIVGDSHSNRVRFDNYTHLLCSAGSAKGLNNPNSISGYNNLIINNINANNYKHLFFLFGGVDVDFSFIHNLFKNPKLNYKKFNITVIDNYLQFITNNFHNKSVIILSVGLPVLDDEHLKTGLLNGHINTLESIDLLKLKNNLSHVDLPNIFKRTEITLHFNKKLKKKIRNLNLPNIKFLDITSFTYDASLKRIHDKFFTRYDHHNEFRNKFFTEIINNFLKTI